MSRHTPTRAAAETGRALARTTSDQVRAAFQKPKVTDNRDWSPLTRERVLVAFGLSPEPELELCRVCNEPVRMQIRKGTGYCCGDCEEAPF